MKIGNKSFLSTVADISGGNVSGLIDLDLVINQNNTVVYDNVSVVELSGGEGYSWEYEINEGSTAMIVYSDGYVVEPSHYEFEATNFDNDDVMARVIGLQAIPSVVLPAGNFNEYTSITMDDVDYSFFATLSDTVVGSDDPDDWDFTAVGRPVSGLTANISGTMSATVTYVSGNVIRIDVAQADMIGVVPEFFTSVAYVIDVTAVKLDDSVIKPVRIQLQVRRSSQ